MTGAPVTRADLTDAPAEIVLRLELERGGSIEQWRSEGVPRLVMQILRKTRTAFPEISYLVDSVACGSLDQAIELLNRPDWTEDERRHTVEAYLAEVANGEHGEGPLARGVARLHLAKLRAGGTAA